MKTCSCCNLEKPLVEFYNNKRTSDGLCVECIVCKKRAARKWYLENIDMARARCLEKARNNPLTKDQANANYLKRRTAALELAKKRIAELPDSYMKNRFFGCHAATEIPVELIEAKRLHIQIKRKLKELKT